MRRGDNRSNRGGTILEQKSEPKKKIVDKCVGEYVNYEETDER